MDVVEDFEVKQESNQSLELEEKEVQNGNSGGVSLVLNRDDVPTVSMDHGDLAVLAHAGVTVNSGLRQGCSHPVEGPSNRPPDLSSTEDRNRELEGPEDPGCSKNTRYYNSIINYILEPSTSKVVNEEQESGNEEAASGSEEYKPESAEEEEDEDESGFEGSGGSGEERQETKPKKSRKKQKEVQGLVKKMRDDAYDEDFEKRIRRVGAEEELAKMEGTFEDDFQELDSGLKIPSCCWKKLYKYQKTGVKWLNVLHEQCVGGILADEMGLGKTIQVICFLRAVSFTQASSRGFRYRGLGPVLIVCPTTLMHQWLKEFHKWFPRCRVALLHSSGTFRGADSRLVKGVSLARKDGSVLITSYTTFTKKRKLLVSTDWHYVILDEGHKIRNPNAQVTMAIKDVRTPHRLILSGSPLQNNLKELWSLIDFIFPGRLGSLQSFTDKFAIPITQGGYANANAVQVRTAYKCACVLRDAISAYMLRRMKKDVEMTIQLPSKTEQVLFCDITQCQRHLYKDYISSRECGRILAGKMDAFVGLIALRKLCNHPDLLTGGPNKHGDYNISIDEDMDFGAPSRSGKMMVLKALLKLWYEQEQKVLIFSQSRQMLTVLEKFVLKEGYSYLRMDGSTTIGSRQPLVEKFNTSKEIFVFLLTTRVGGLGVNLTGANRVVIFDPDWNPSTDVQARERAWRIGQERPVTIYRLLSSGTIEEKIYHRQIFKQFLANRVLADPKQKRFFKTNDLYELFTLGDDKTIKAKGTETASIFHGTAEEISRDNYFDRVEKERKRNEKKDRKKKEKKKFEDNSDDDEDAKEIVEAVLPPERIAELREIARRISRSFTKRLSNKTEKSSREAEGEQNPKKEQGLGTRNESEGSENTKSKKKNKKRLFDKKYELPYLRRQSSYKETKDGSEEKQSKEQDDYVLGMLLKNSGVHSAIRHDQIVSENSADVQLVEDEANAVAKRAADSLRRSRRRPDLDEPQAKRPRFGQKTAAGFSRLEDSKRFERCSSEQPLFSGNALLKPENSGESLVDAIRNRKQRLLDDRDDDDAEQQEREYPSLVSSSSESALKPNRFDQLAEDIRTFLAVRDGKATTFEVLEKFKNDVGVRDSTAFRSILRKLCTFYSETRTWRLKDEYR